jgi:hypothetical protein
MYIIYAVLTCRFQVPILPDSNDQTGIVAAIQEGEPGELVRCVEIYTNFQFTALCSGTSIC